MSAPPTAHRHWAPEILPAAVRRQIDALLDTREDPISAFIYDLASLRTHTRWMKDHLPAGVEFYYAIKANSEAEILSTIAPWVDGFEVSSGGEIEKVINCPLRKNFVFSGPGKLDSELRQAVSQRAEMIHLESLSEISRLEAIAAKLNTRQPVLIRVNPTLPARFATKLSMAGAATPFGIDERQLARAVAAVQRSQHLRLSGFHIHAMSHQTDTEHHRQLLNLYLEKWPQWTSLARDPNEVRYLNVGGGMGVDYLRAQHFDWPALCDHLQKALTHYPNGPVLRFEPGRFVTAFCGYYLMEILDIKRNHDQNFVICRGGTHQFRLPAAQNHDHPIVHLRLHRDGGKPTTTAATFTVVGQLCTPKDALSRHCPLTDPRVGDLLVLPLAGAYGYHISHCDFLCHPRPPLLFIDNDESGAPPRRNTHDP